jgi:hypothetical protein
MSVVARRSVVGSWEMGIDDVSTASRTATVRLISMQITTKPWENPKRMYWNRRCVLVSFTHVVVILSLRCPCLSLDVL